MIKTKQELIKENQDLKKQMDKLYKQITDLKEENKYLSTLCIYSENKRTRSKTNNIVIDIINQEEYYKEMAINESVIDDEYYPESEYL